ncbi:MAG: putative toxin-antitoxin system toxin component, PIN family [Anaerolineaceae bacterium]|jgi:putative PIN family toxin of toxin-antitoxin system|nr:putative toxin-antitoxin system toxin component, PIN family [Anaerolineaceae bacterium]
MILVLDTNVIISALLSPKGSPAKVIDLWEAEAFDIATSKQLLNELARALEYKRVKKYFKQPQEKINALLKRFRTVGVMVDQQFELNVIVDDPDDNRVLECAVAANASYIISGDDHLLDLEKYREIVILTPAGFLKLLNVEGKRKG